MTIQELTDEAMEILANAHAAMSMSATDTILDEYYRLSTMNVIEDIKEHVEAWRNLAILAALDNRIQTSINCLTRAGYWFDQVPCIRLVEGSFSKLIPIISDEKYETLPEYDWQSRADMGD